MTTQCPKCGGTKFRIYVAQRIFVEFENTEDGDSGEVVSGPEGDLEWDDQTEAICDACDHVAPLGEMH